MTNKKTILHEYYTETTKHCEKEVTSIDESIEVAKELIIEKGLDEVKIVMPNDVYYVRPPKKRTTKKQKENE